MGGRPKTLDTLFSGKNLLALCWDRRRDLLRVEKLYEPVSSRNTESNFS